MPIESPPLPSATQAELRGLLARMRSAVWGVALLSAVLNVLLLSGSIFMMLVYDMVMPAHAIPTLIGLLGMVSVVYLFQAFLEVVRGRVLIHAAGMMDSGLSPAIHRMVGLLARSAPGGDSLQPVRDLDAVRGYLSSSGPTALVDLPWMVFFVGILFVLHVWIGLTVLVGGAILVGLTALAHHLSAAPGRTLSTLVGARIAAADTSRRHAETIHALGMEQRMAARFVASGRNHLAAQARMAEVTSVLGGASKTFRQLLQSLVLSVGAILVMRGDTSGGVIFASSILSSRALAPVEQVIAHWRGLTSARQSWARLKRLLAALPAEGPAHALPAPTRDLSVEGLSVVAPGSDRVIVQQIGFAVSAGQAVAVLGPSGAGKSTLARALVGAIDPAAGAVRLDGATLDQWRRETLGDHLGYLPQTVELFAGTVAENIARFRPDAPAEGIVDAARRAGVHDLILHLPEGYATDLGNDGARLSAGQRQRIGLARALYGDPFLIVMDEPNSNLDAAGDAALVAAIVAARARGAIVIVVAHRPQVLTAVDSVLLMQDGRARAFGPKEVVVPELLPGSRRAGDRLARPVRSA